MAGTAGGTGRWPVAALAVGMVAVLGSAAWMVAHRAPLVAVRRCVSPNEPLAWLGVHLEVLREHPGCAEGQLALSAGPGHAAGLVLMVAVPTLLTNLATVLGALGVWAALRVLLARASAVVGRLWPRPPAVRAVADGRRQPAAPRWPAELVLRAWQLDRSPVCRRGPPVRTAS
ncbi:hypothetical protein [Dactylosporangium sp. NPDC051484]|uniref:hypothetical protein n=1 Tax=Dactylosporangium sp. NPDC051484 TaxID=3154942 RepID=UPI00344C47A5